MVELFDASRRAGGRCAADRFPRPPLQLCRDAATARTASPPGSRRWAMARATGSACSCPTCRITSRPITACSKLGATVVNFSPLYTVDELAHQVEDSGTRLLFTVSATALLPTALEGARAAASSNGWWSDRSRARCRRPSRCSTACSSAAKSPTRPDDPRITAFSQLIANDGEHDRRAIDPSKRSRADPIYRRHHRHAQGRDAHATRT